MDTKSVNLLNPSIIGHIEVEGNNVVVTFKSGNRSNFQMSEIVQMQEDRLIADDVLQMIKLLKLAL